MAKTQAQRQVQQQRTRGLEVGRAATEVYGRRRIPCAVQHGPGACTAVVAAAAKETRDQPQLLDLFVSHMGQHRRAAGRRARRAAHARASMCTLLLCAMGRGLYSSTLRTRSKGTPVGSLFFGKRVMVACGSSAFVMNATLRTAFCRDVVSFSPSLIGWLISWKSFYV